MLLVETFLAPSSISGIGLFAAEDIAEGREIWRLNPDFDRVISPEALGELPETAREFMVKYAFLSKQLGMYVLGADDDRFTNHSYTPNRLCVVETPGFEVVDLAAGYIATGTELTNDYSQFDAEFETYAHELG